MKKVSLAFLIILIAGVGIGSEWFCTAHSCSFIFADANSDMKILQTAAADNAATDAALGFNTSTASSSDNSVHNDPTQINSNQNTALSTAAASPKNSLTIVVSGGIAFNRASRSTTGIQGFENLFAPIASLLYSANIRIANLIGSKPNPTLASSTALILKNAGFNLISIPGTQSIVTKNGIKIALVDFYATAANFEAALTHVKELTKEGDFVIAMPEWNAQYSSSITAEEREQAQELATAGAGATIGMHPNIIEDHEWIGKMPVFFSIGTLFSNGQASTSENSDLLELHLVKTATTTKVASIDVYPVTTISESRITFSDQSTTLLPGE